MKNKQGFYGAAAIGGAAGVLRVLQYIFTIDQEGYYARSGFSSFLSGMLIGILAVGVLWSFFSGRSQKQAVSFGILPKRNPLEQICFALLGGTALINGLVQLIGSGGSALPALAGLLMLAGGAGWLLLAAKGSRAPALIGLLPVLQLAALLLVYFRETYKFIQVSEYTIVTLGLCALCYFTLLLMKVQAGAECTKARLTVAACLVLVFGGAAFIAPLAGNFSPMLLLQCVQGSGFILLAALVLKQLPEDAAPAEEPQEAPDLSQLDEYISNIPDVEENENENDNT